VQLVDEQDAVARVFHFLDDLLQPLLELAAVLRARHQRADVQREQPLAHQRLGHVARGDPLGEALDDRRLADAGLADQGRIVLRAPREDLDDPLDLLGAPDHGVQLIGAGGGGQVHAELVDDRRLGRVPGLLLRVALALVQDVDHLRTDLVQRDAERLQHAGGDALALADQAEQEVLGADVVVVQPPRLVDGQLDHLLGARGQADVAGDGPIAAADDELDGRPHLVQLNPEVGEHLGRDALTFADQAQEEVLSADVVVVEPLSLFLCKLEHLARPLGKFVESVSHRITPSLGRSP
jgi:hypothetical protein